MLLHMDGFDEYVYTSDLNQEYAAFNVNQFGITWGRWGGGAPYLDDNGRYLSWSNGNTLTEIWSGVAYKINPGNVSGGVVMEFWSGSGVEASVTYDPYGGSWNCYRGQFSTVLGGYVYPISWNQYHWIEIHYKISTTVGIMEVWVDGSQIVNVTGANTTQNSVTNFSAVWLGSLSNTCRGYFDDWYVLDTTGTYNNTRLGDSRIETLRPQSDAGPNNGVPSTAGPHYAMVDELQWSSSNSIILGSTAGNAEVFGMTSLSTAPTNIHAVRVLAVAEKTDAGALSANAIVISSNVEADGNSTTLNSSFAHVFNVFETDPNTGVPWAYTAVNAMDCGIKIP